ncbi:MAG: hypothetical protein U9Q76_09530, partial [candidate division WOR-3 bacterium]|nr:hypothetical protein [candidate division WOR-3 bacterium]
QEQHALRGWRSSPAPVSELTFISKFEAIKALEQYFLREGEGAPGDKIDCLLRDAQGDFIPTAKEMSQVKEGDLFSLFFSGEPDVRRDIRQRYMTDDEYALKLLRKYVAHGAGYESSHVKDIELYLQQVADWKKLTDNAPLPVGHKWFLGNPIRIERRPFLYDFNQQGPLNYVPPEEEAFDVASVPSFGLPLTGYGAGFLGMPSGDGGKATSSSLSLPSFPSPVGFEGAGRVSSTPSVGLPGLGWGGAAMPAPSIGLSGIGGGSAPSLPSPRSLGGGSSGAGGMGGGLAGGGFGGGLGAGAWSIPSGGGGLGLGAQPLAEIPSGDRFMPKPIGGPQANYSGIGLGRTPLNQMNAPQQSQQPAMQPQQLVRMVINRHEEISKEKLEQYVSAWLESQSRVG